MPTNSVPHGSPIEAKLLDLFLFMGSAWILYLLLALSVISLAITIERLLHFYQNRFDLESLAQELDARLTQGETARAKELLQASKSHSARIALRGLDGIGRGPAAMEEILAGASQVEKLRMERGLAYLGTLGNNAPFIGLFGTVLGIIRAFRDLSQNTIEGSSAVMAGIAEALVATAVGLLVALPAVAVFNGFQRHIKSKLAESDVLARVLLAHAKTEK